MIHVLLMMLFHIVQNNNILIFNNPDISDAGSYTCRSKRNNLVNATTTLKIRGVFYLWRKQLNSLLYWSILSLL